MDSSADGIMKAIYDWADQRQSRSLETLADFVQSQPKDANQAYVQGLVDAYRLLAYRLLAKPHYPEFIKDILAEDAARGKAVLVTRVTEASGGEMTLEEQATEVQAMANKVLGKG